LAFLPGNVKILTADDRSILYANFLNLRCFPEVGLAHLLQAADVASSIPQEGLRLVGSTLEVSSSYDKACRQWTMMLVSKF
jgi:hypothetical protein